MTALRRLYTRPSRVFISYRWKDASGVAEHLYYALRKRWGARYIRMDHHDISPGTEFNQAALEQIAKSDALLVVIGPRWLPDRLASPADFVRQEIEKALEKKVRVIPVLVDGASLPDADALPPSLRPLLERRAFELSNQRLAYDVGVLASHLEGLSWRRVGVVVLVLFLAFGGAYVLQSAITGETQGTGGHGSPSGSANRPGGTPPSAPVIVDTASPAAPGGASLPALETEGAPKTSPPDSPRVSAPPSGPRPAASPPPAPATEPHSRPASAPTTGSVVASTTYRIGPEQFRAYDVTINESRPCRLRGRVEAIDGGSRDIGVLVLDEHDFGRFTRRSPRAPILNARRTREISLDVPLPGPGRYHFVISNYFSAFEGKVVSVEDVRWECAEAGSDASP